MIDEDKPSFGMNVTVDSPDVVEIIGKTGLVDYIEFEAEYIRDRSSAKALRNFLYLNSSDNH